MSTPQAPAGRPEAIEMDRLNAWRDQALRQAPALRREAIADFWRGADAAFSATLGSAQRSAARLTHRLARHLQARQQPTLEA
jgi:hypothetical protein